MTYNNVYPYYVMLVDKMQAEIQHNIEFRRYEDPNVILHILLDKLEYFKRELLAKPTLSATNFEKLVNELYIQSKESNCLLDGVIVPIHFVKNADVTRFAKLNPINLAK